MLPTRGLASGRLHIVTGKGGTGKTTCAAALAIALATGGRRALVVEVEGRDLLFFLDETFVDLRQKIHHLECISACK